MVNVERSKESLPCMDTMSTISPSFICSPFCAGMANHRIQTIVYYFSNKWLYLEPERIRIQWFATANEVLIISFVNNPCGMRSHDDGWSRRNNASRAASRVNSFRCRIRSRQILACNHANELEIMLQLKNPMEIQSHLLETNTIDERNCTRRRARRYAMVSTDY